MVFFSVAVERLTIQKKKGKTEMPHDAHGNLIQAGDEVVIPATVKQVHNDGPYCNVDLELKYPMPAYPDQKSQMSAINTRQVEKAMTLGIGSAEAGEAAYSGYLAACGGKSLISGAPLPAWGEQDPKIQEAWCAAAAAAVLFAGSVPLTPVP